MHKYLNIALILITLALSVSTVALSANDVKLVSKLESSFGLVPQDNITMLYNINIAMTVTTVLLLLMAVGAFKFNVKWFGILKLFLCVVTLILAIMSMAIGSKLLNSGRSYGQTGVAAGVLGLFAVGSCSFTAVKMLL